MSNIITAGLIAIWGLLLLTPIIRVTIIYSKSRKLKFLRKLFWIAAINKLLENSSHDYKVHGYLGRYVKNSIAIKQYYINHGFYNTKVMLIGKLEDIERFVEKYKYNTFDNLTIDEEDFINKYLRESKKSSPKNPPS